MAEISQVQLPSGSQYSIRDRAAVHYLGVSTTSISEGAAASPVTIVVEGITYTTDSTVTIDDTHKKLHCYDWVIYNNECFLFLVTVTNNTESYSWKKFGGSNLDIQVDGTSIISNNTADIITTGSSQGGTAYDPSTNPITTKGYVDDAIEAAIETLPDPMVFKGTLGTGGTITTLPTDGTAAIGDTYKVITAGTYAGQVADLGDLFICLTKTENANTWAYVPSGDEPNYTAANGIEITNNDVIQHTNSITAQTDKHVKRVTFDAQGHITGATNAETVTIKNPTKKTVVTDMSVAEPSSTAATGELAYYSVSNETLILKKIVETTGDSITTTDVTNVVKDVDAT